MGAATDLDRGFLFDPKLLRMIQVTNGKSLYRLRSPRLTLVLQRLPLANSPDACIFPSRRLQTFMPPREKSIFRYETVLLPAFVLARDSHR